MTPTASGTVSSPIYIKRVQAGDAVPTSAAGWDSSFDSQVIVHSPGASAFFVSAKNVGSCLYIDGRVDSGISFQIDNTAAGSYPGAVMFSNSSGFQHDVTFANCEIVGPNGSGTYNNPYYTSCISVQSSASGGGTWGWNYFTNFTFTYCRIHGAPEIVNVYNARHFIWDHCQIYDNIADTSANGQHANVWEMGSPDGCIVRYCNIYNWSVEGFFTFNTCGTNTFYGNVWHDTSSGWQTPFVVNANYAVQGALGPIYFYNNTVIFPSGISAIFMELFSGQSWNASSQLRNNIVMNAGTINIPSDHDYDLFSASQGEAHGLVNSSTGIFVNAASQNYQIVSNVSSTFPKDKGTPVPNANGLIYNLDLNGNTRGADGAWDIGAYEYTSSIVTPLFLLVPKSYDVAFPNSYSFGSTPTNSAVTNAGFTIQNVGTVAVTGTCSTTAPFFIVSGSSYNLAPRSNQILTLAFKPMSISNYTGTIVFAMSGGVGTNVAVSGRGTASSIPASPQGPVLTPGP
jgi:hypothetical protein